MITVLDYKENPIHYMGKMAGVCYGTDTTDFRKNYKRGLDVLKANHGRVLEFPDVVLEITGYSNRVIRELYTHIVGVTRLQESTRYIDMGERFDEYYIPSSIKASPKASKSYADAMSVVKDVYLELTELGVPREDLGNLVPMGQHTKVVLKINLRALLNMFEVRTCTRAYKEYRKMMAEIKNRLRMLDTDWDEIMEDYTGIKCDKLGYCPESKSCGRHPKKGEELRHFHPIGVYKPHMPAFDDNYVGNHTHDISHIHRVTTDSISSESIIGGNIATNIGRQTTLNLGEGI